MGLHGKQAYISSYEPVILSSAVTDEELDSQIAFIMKDACWTEGDYVVKPALTDSWVEGNIDGCSTVGEFKERLMHDLSERKRAFVEQNKRALALNAFTERLHARLDEAQVRSALSTARSAFERELSDSGSSRAEYLASQKMTLEELEHRQEADVRLQIRRGVALDLLARHLGISEGGAEQNRLSAIEWLEKTAVIT